MTADQKLRRAAEVLWGAWTSEQPLDAVPDELRPDTVEEGYAVQRALDELGGTCDRMEDRRHEQGRTGSPGRQRSLGGTAV